VIFARLRPGFFLPAMDGRHAENAGAFFGCAPWMAGMPKMQEHFSAAEDH
jgi:hypothetical protein